MSNQSLNLAFAPQKRYVNKMFCLVATNPSKLKVMLRQQMMADAWLDSCFGDGLDDVESTPVVVAGPEWERWQCDDENEDEDVVTFITANKVFGNDWCKDVIMTMGAITSGVQCTSSLNRLLGAFCIVCSRLCFHFRRCPPIVEPKSQTKPRKSVECCFAGMT